MPNHTDVAAFFHGNPERLAMLRSRCRQEKLKPDNLMSKWLAARSAMDWTALVTLGNAEPLPLFDPLGNMPANDENAPFTLNAGIPMPASMHVEESGWSELASNVLLGKWRSAPGPRHEALRRCSTQEEALAWMEADCPGSVAQGRARLDNISKHGAPSWYEWSTRNWGTKWDAYETRWAKPALGGRLQEIRFQTAWSPPLPALAAMCASLGISCSCSYIDEGGGFSDYATIGPDGVVFEAGQELGRKAHAAAKRAAREALAASLPPPSRRASKAEPLAWPERMDLGLPIGDKHFGSECPAPLSAESSRRILDAIAPGSPGASQAALALEALHANGVASPSMLLSNGYPLGHALALGLWLPGLQWAWSHAGSGLKDEVASIALAQALLLNAPAPAAWAWLSLSPDKRPDPSNPMIHRAPESAAAIGDADPGARHAMAGSIAKSIADLGRMDADRSAFLRSAVDRLSILDSTPLRPSASNPRPRPRI